MSKYGLIGAVLGHSYSKLIHEALGNSDYSYFELTPQALEDFFARREFRGVNVTIPYKVDAMRLCDEVSAEARAIGCVNTVVNRGGRLFGFNTDAYGLSYMIRNAKITLEGKKVLILGSGGTSRTARYVASVQGASQTVVISRSGEDNYQNISRHFDADVIINATPVGMYPNMDASPVSLDGFKRLSGVLDVIYNPSQTDLLFEARERGIARSNGLIMLVAQARRAHELFFDTKLEDSVIDRVTSALALSSQSIVLTGMPGVGKSTLGKLLAARLGLEFVDTDKLVERDTGTAIPEFIAQHGEPCFRDAETRALASATGEGRRVIATGGGAILREENRKLIGRNAIVLGLDAPDERLVCEGRPLSSGVGAIQRLRQTRNELYHRVADLMLVTSTDPLQTLSDALALLKVSSDR